MVRGPDVQTKKKNDKKKKQLGYLTESTNPG